MKNAVALAVAALVGAGGTIGAQALLIGAAGQMTYRAHQIDIRQSQLENGTQPTGFSYITGLVSLVDGGIQTVDLSGHPCPLDTKAVQDCAKVLLAHGSTEACR